MLTSLSAFTVAAALLVILPGPDTLVVVRSIVRGGRRRGIWTAAGGLTGLVVWVTITAVGLASLLRASHDAYLVLKIAGAAYLVWLGVQSIRSRGTRPVAQGSAASEAGESGSGTVVGSARRGEGFGAGLATNLLNPKIGVLFVALLPGFIPAGYSVGATSVLLGGIYIVESALYVAVLIALSGPVVRWMSDARIRRRLDRLMGAVLVGFGVQLATKG